MYLGKCLNCNHPVWIVENEQPIRGRVKIRNFGVQSITEISLVQTQRGIFKRYDYLKDMII